VATSYVLKSDVTTFYVFSPLRPAIHCASIFTWTG